MEPIQEKSTDFVTLGFYKEPLKKLPEGLHGYEGVLLGTVDGTKVQCHICGNWYEGLSMHVYASHSMNAQKYREVFKLTRRTALVSESRREILKNQTLIWLNSMSYDEKRKLKAKSREKYLEYVKENQKAINDRRFQIRLETKNIRGSCPDQILAKIEACAKQIGKTPTKNEFIDFCGGQRYVHLIYATFGSYLEALKRLNLSPDHRSQTGGTKKNYSEEELIDLLKVFYQETGKIPTQTDFSRGLLPPANTYVRRFGSIQKARELADIYETPLRWKKEI